MSDYHFFYGQDSVFSQWYPSVFTEQGFYYNCAEQYMMAQKAVLFQDKEVWQRIMQATKPYDQKLLGRTVRGFDKDIWERNCKFFVYQGNYLKFTQNPKLLQLLLAIKHDFVEASPVDQVWGIGLSVNHPHAYDKSKWKGTNWLGEILTKLRNDLCSAV